MVRAIFRRIAKRHQQNGNEVFREGNRFPERIRVEMSIAAKSRMIMKEAGMDIPTDPDTHKANLDKLEEFKSLRKNIGVSGLLVLSPIINTKAVDEWVIRNL